MQQLLQVLAMATSRVDMSQHWTTSNFFCALEETDFLEMWLERHRSGQLYCSVKVIFLKPSERKKLGLTHVPFGNKKLNM